MQAGKITRVFREDPVYIAEDENKNLIVSKNYFQLGILVNTNRIQEQNIILSEQDKIRVRKFLDETELYYFRVPQLFAIHFVGDYAEEIKDSFMVSGEMNASIIEHFDEFVALLLADESFDNYVFIKNS